MFTNQEPNEQEMISKYAEQKMGQEQPKEDMFSKILMMLEQAPGEVDAKIQALTMLLDKLKHEQSEGEYQEVK